MLRWLVVVGLAILLAGCGEGSSADTADTNAKPPPEPKLREVPMTLDGTFGPENAAIPMAIQEGYFEDVGLNLHAMVPSPPSRPVKYVIERVVDVAVSHEPQVVMAQASGRPVVALGSLVAEPTMAMIWLQESKIDGVADLKGKTIAIPGAPFQEKLLEAVLRQAGLTLADVKLDVVEHKLLPALVSGRADAIFGGSGNVEGEELEVRGLKPVVTPVTELGVPSYDELVVIARPDAVAKDPELYRRIMAAIRRGTAAAIADPEGATEAIITGLDGEGYPVNRRAIEAGLAATSPLLTPGERLDRKQKSELADWMRREGLLTG